MTAPSPKPLVSIEALTVRAGTATILRGISLDVHRRAILGVVGESGSGKSTLGAALMGLLPPGLAAEGRIGFGGQDLLALAPAAMQRLRGRDLAMVAQDPMTALNPLFTVGTHLIDVARRRHPDFSRKQARAAAERMLHRVGIADPAARMAAYPHELSGGMRQRVAIGMALLADPVLLVADEPTTALDATVEAQIAALFAGLRADMAGSIVFISHHLGLVAQLCDSICVLYGGSVVETGPAAAVTQDAKHPYTQALLACEIDAEAAGPLRFIPGDVPSPAATITGCSFAPRCPLVQPQCRMLTPPLATKAPDHRAACLLVPDA